MRPPHPPVTAPLLSPVRARALGLALVIAAGVFPRMAAAQEEPGPRVVVVPWLVGADAPSDTDAALRRLGDQVPEGALTGALLASTFENRGSRAAHLPDDATLDAWRTLSRQAVRAIAQGEYDEGEAALARAEQLVSGSLSTLARDDERARTLLDTCLYGVRALAETHEPHAQARATACRRMLPTVAPTPHLHPPEVLAMLDRAERALAAEPAATLTITSDVDGCAVRLDGIAIGETPLVADALPPGTYEIVVEPPGAASSAARVHTVTLDETPLAISVDTTLERALRTDGSLRLVYDTIDDAIAERVAHGLALASTLGASELWLVAAGDADLVERIDVATGVPIALDRTASDRAYAGAGLAPPRRSELELAMGGTMLALGSAAWITSLALVAPAQGYGALATQPFPTDVDYLDRRNRWESWEAPMLALGTIGPALAAASLPLLVEHEDEVPWWSWALGAVGVVTLGTGLGLAASAPTCGHERPSAECVEGTARLDAGIATLSAGLSLVTLPLTHLVRSAIDAPVRVDASASTTGLGAAVTLAL